MTPSDFKRLVSYDNLLLAWRRVTTAKNISYKRFFRSVYYAYEWGAERNIKDLEARLKGGSYEPKPPTRIYVPKPSGLHRSITLLEIEDQIVFQALANTLATKAFARRTKLQGKCAFSNLLQPPGSIFFVEDWRHGYALFQEKIKNLYTAGYCWVAQFDLAAFYDTISHELVLKAIYPKTKASEARSTILSWMKTWSTPRTAHQFSHGIPQGPIASDMFAELFLMPLDEQMCSRHQYARYVDDIRLFGKTEREVRSAVQHLEILCRDRGIIPQAKKFAIMPVTSAQEALGTLPSLKLEDADQLPKPLPEAKIFAVFRSALNGRPLRIRDKTRARFALFRGSPSRNLRDLVLKLLPHHPEHIEAMVYYLQGCGRCRATIGKCSQHLLNSPDEYVQGELFQLLAPIVSKTDVTKSLVRVALSIVKNRHGSVSAKWGALRFLFRAHALGIGDYAGFILTQPATAQALALKDLPDDVAGQSRVAHTMLARNAISPGLAYSEWMLANKKTLADFGIAEDTVPTQVKNVFSEMGLLASSGGVVDPMAELIAKRYSVKTVPVWRPLLGGEYSHALQQLKQAEALFDMGRSQWLNYQNSFNHALFIALQGQLNSRGLAGACKIVGSGGHLVKYGSQLDPNQPFGKAHPIIAVPLRMCNTRRNSLDSSHPYDEKTRSRNTPLRRIEQSHLKVQLGGAYTEIIVLCKTMGM